MSVPARVDSARLGLALFVSFVVIAALSWWAKAFEQEFYGDSAGHYITGLALHDFFFSGRFTDPLGYLTNYFVHYPAIGLGHWPPAFYIVEALWMAVFGWTKPSIVLLIVLVSAATSAAVFAAAAAHSGVVAGALGAVMFVASPVVMATFGVVMIDVLVALLCFLAVLAFVKYMKDGRAIWSLLFALLAAAAILTKGNAVLLGLVPIFSIVLGRRFDLLRRPSLWVGAVVVALLVLPWYAVTYKWTAKGFLYEWGAEYTWLAIWFNCSALFRALGAAGVVLAFVGGARAILGGRDEVLLQVCVALTLACFIFQAVVPTALVARYVIPALPPMLVLAAAGAASICERISRPLVVWPALFGLVLLTMVPSLAHLPRAERWELKEVIPPLLMELAAANPVILASVGPMTEAAIITEVAQRDEQRPGFVVLRGSRLLGGGGFMKQDYQPRYDDIEDVRDAIRKHRIPVIILEVSNEASRWVHNAQVRELIERNSSEFDIVRRFYPGGRGSEFWIVKVSENAHLPAAWNELHDLGRPKRAMPGG